MRVVIFTDIHANLPTLEELVMALSNEGSDFVFHLGDALNIGPFPSETLNLLMDIPSIQFIRGNHEDYVLSGVPYPYPDYISNEEPEHFEWTFNQLNLDQIKIIRNWPYVKNLKVNKYKVSFIHFGLSDNQNNWVSYVFDPNEANLNRAFQRTNSDLIFFGHDHNPTDIIGESHFINPGSAGCNKLPMIRYCVADFEKKEYKIEHITISYNKALVIKELKNRNVPARKTIEQMFF